MREVWVRPPAKWKKVGAVHRLQFDLTGRELVAWVEAPETDEDHFPGVTCGVFACDLGADTARSLLADDWFKTFGDYCRELVVQPTLDFLAVEFDFDGDVDGLVSFENLRGPDDRELNLHVPARGLGAIAFTADGAELVAVRNDVTDGQRSSALVRFETSALGDRPGAFREQKNPLTGQPYRAPARTWRWKPAGDLPSGEVGSALGLSADKRRAVVGTERSALHVVDLKRKKVTASFPWEGRKLRYTAAVRVAFDPAAKWVVMLASGRLFARPLGAGTPWHTREKLGEVRDFAYHPSGRVLCAVFEDGEARYLDPQTGAARESFRWSKTPLHSVCFSPDGLTCAAGGAKGRVVLWDVDV